ncbi:MAG TPA: preprotein translocase subunit YajC [Haliangium sp.]|nr:preprotein translocase subunit YajC [Haliangium sp.]
MMLLMFGVFYFLLIRPQVKKQREHQNMLKRLDKGDTVVTRGGLVGKVTGVTDNVLVIELQEKVRVRVLRTHVEGRFEPGAAAVVEKDRPAKEAA